MELIWSALITNREFSLLDSAMSDTDFWEQELPKTVTGTVNIDEHEIKIEVGGEIIRIYHVDQNIIVSRDTGLTKEILLGEIKNGNNKPK